MHTANCVYSIVHTKQLPGIWDVRETSDKNTFYSGSEVWFLNRSELTSAKTNIYITEKLSIRNGCLPQNGTA